MSTFQTLRLHHKQEERLRFKKKRNFASDNLLIKIETEARRVSY